MNNKQREKIIAKAIKKAKKAGWQLTTKSFIARRKKCCALGALWAASGKATFIDDQFAATFAAEKLQMFADWERSFTAGFDGNPLEPDHGYAAYRLGRKFRRAEIER